MPGGKLIRLTGIATDITARKQPEQALRESEEHFRFLHDVAEATHALADPHEIMTVTAPDAGSTLHASHCAYAEVDKDGGQFTILHDYTEGIASTGGPYQLSPFGAKALAKLHAGKTLIIRDLDRDLLSGDGADMLTAIGAKAIVTCPLIKEGGLRVFTAAIPASVR